MGTQTTARDKPNFDPYSNGESKPVHEVTLDPYFLSKFEMTQDQWLRSVGHNPSYYHPKIWRRTLKPATTLLHPLENVSWIEADRNLRRLGLLLPTEAQWERAARGGNSQHIWPATSSLEEIRRFSNLNGMETKAMDLANQQSNHLDDYVFHAPVGSFEPNLFGLFDVCGNIWEWCNDSLRDYPGRLRAGDGQRGELSIADDRIYRGGNFYAVYYHARMGFRQNENKATHNGHIGIRPARALKR